MKLLFVRKLFVYNVCTNFRKNLTSCLALYSVSQTDEQTDGRTWYSHGKEKAIPVLAWTGPWVPGV